jgi:large subunit ribosomal protein L1
LKYKRKEVSSAKKKKAKTTFDEPDLRNMQQFALVDAMR